MKLAPRLGLLLLATFVLAAGTLSGRAQNMPPDLDVEADAYAAEIAGRSKDQLSVDTALGEIAVAEREGDTGAVITGYEHLATVEPKSYRAWLQLAAAWRRVTPASEKAMGAAVTAWRVGTEDAEKFEALLMVAGLLRDRLAIAQQDFERARQRIVTIEETSKLWKIPIDPNVAPDTDTTPLSRDFVSARAEAYAESITAAEKIGLVVSQLDQVYVEVFTIVQDPAAYEQVSQELVADVFQVAPLSRGSSEEEEDDTPRYDVVAETLDDHSRACVRFSLPVALDTDAARAAFSLRDGDTGTPTSIGSVEIEDDRVCILGLEPDRDYILDIDATIRSQTGASLAELVAGIAIAVPPRDPLVGFRGSAFILPRQGSGDVPLYTVNMKSVPLHLLRITDRNLYRHVALGHIGSRLPTDEYREMREQFSDAIWDGAIAIASEPNKLVTSQVPVLRIIEGRKSWLKENPVLDDGNPLAQVSPPLPIGTALEGAFSADRVSYQSAPEFDHEAGLYALVTDSLDDTLKKAAGEQTEGETFCEEFCAESYVVQWIVRTDIGLAFYEFPDRLHVVARSLASGKAIAGATVELVAANNRVLAEATTDLHGVAGFPRRLTEGTRGNRLAVVMARSADDFSFIDFSTDRLDLSRLGVFGRSAPPERNVYLYTDRGMYRPDDTVNLTLLMRNSAGLLSPAMSPVKVRLVAGDTPLDEVEVARDDWRLGGVNLSLRIPETARLGAAEVEVVDPTKDGETLAAATIQIDHFRPDRARIHYIDNPGWTADADRGGRLSLSGTVAADYLFGDARVVGQAAAGNLRSEVDVKVEAAETPVEGCYEGVSFGPAGDAPPPVMLGRIDGVTDAQGRLHFASEPRPWMLPALGRPVQATVAVTLFDNAGPVGSRSRSLGIREDRDWIGIARNPRLRPASADGAFVLAFDVIGVDGANRPLSTRKLSFKLFSERDVFVWEQRNGVWTSASNVAREEISASWPEEAKSVQLAGVVGAAAAGCVRPGATIETELPLGRYLLEVTDELSGATAATRFVTGSTTATIRDPEPNILEVASDRKRYSAGETAKLQVYAPFDGEVQVAIADSDILEWMSGTTTDRVANVEVPIRQEWAGKGLYALVTVYRRQTDGTTVRGPARAIGTTYVEVAGEEKNFDLTISAPLQARPEEPIKVSACISSGSNCLTDFQQDGYVSLFAVDEGLISLTAHPVANPHGHYFGQVRLPIAIMDNYGRILLTEQGGDRPSRLALSNYTSDKIVSVLSGPVRLANGAAEIDIPSLDFDGSVRLVAIAWTAEGVAADDETLTVSDSIVPRLDVPRFFTPGDRPVVPLVLSNRELGPGPYRVRVETPDGVSVTGIADASGISIRDGETDGFSITLDRGATATSYVSLDIAESAGADDVRLAVVIEDLDIRRETLVPVRPSAPAILETVAMTLPPDQSISIADLTRDFIAGRYNEIGLSLDTQVSGNGPITLLAPASGAEVAETPLLDRLVWAGMLLASQPAASANGGETRARIAEIVRGIQALQARNGSFFPYRPLGDLVPQESEDPNRDFGYEFYDPNLVSSLVFRTALALDFLNAVSGKYDWKPTGGAVPVSLAVVDKAADFLAKANAGSLCTPATLYAKLVLIPLGRVDDDDVQRLHQVCPPSTATPLAQAMMAAFYGEFGRSELGEEVFVNFDVGSLAAGSTSTKIAMTLSFLVQAKAPEALLRAVYDELVELGVPRSVELSDQVWLSRSALAQGRPEAAPEPSIEVTPDGFLRPAGETGGSVLTSGFVDYAQIAGKNVSIRNAGQSPLSLAIVLEGTPTEAGSRESSTADVRRRLFDRAGNEIDPVSAKVAIGDNLLVVVEGMFDGEDLAAGTEGMADLSPAVIIADLLPAAFEIVTADAFATDAGSPPPSLPRGVTPVGKLRSVEAGDDRLVAVVIPYDLESVPQPDGEAAEPPPPVDFRIAYYVRVVSSGDFLLPGTFVEPLAQPSTTRHSESARLSIARPAAP